ncbi:hypothetical protein BGZ94_009155, partial [Podila epigama]
MSHSRANNESADLEHLELTEELLGHTANDSQIDIPSPVSLRDRDSRRVSINSQNSTNTVKPNQYHHPHILSEPSPRSGAGTRTSPIGSSATSLKPKPSFRHSSVHIGADAAAAAANGGRRRHRKTRPGSSRSSIRRRTRSSDVDEDDEDEDYDNEAYDGPPSFLEDYPSDHRSNHSHLRRGSSRRSVRLDDHDVRSFDGHDPRFNDDDDDDASDAEPLTLKDRQE